MLAEMFVREGFRRKEFRGKLAIAITANFKNRNTTAEAKVEEISGVAFIFNQRFFQELRQETGTKMSFLIRRSDTYTAKGHWCRPRTSSEDQSGAVRCIRCRTDLVCSFCLHKAELKEQNRQLVRTLNN